MYSIRSLYSSALTCLLLFAVLLNGCAIPQTGNVYSRKETRQASTVTYGKITHLHHVHIKDDPSLLGSLGGAVIGGVAASTMGRGTGRTLMTLGGAVLGYLAGTEIEKSINNRDGLQITVHLDNGQTLAIVQELGPEERSFAVGQRVYVTHGNDGSARVQRQ